MVGKREGNGDVPGRSCVVLRIGVEDEGGNPDTSSEGESFAVVSGNGLGGDRPDGLGWPQGAARATRSALHDRALRALRIVPGMRLRFVSMVMLALGTAGPSVSATSRREVAPLPEPRWMHVAACDLEGRV